MKILIHGKNLELTEALKAYTEAKIEKATHHYKDIVKEADIHLSVEKIQGFHFKQLKLQFLLIGLLSELKRKQRIFIRVLIWFQINFVENYVNIKKGIIKHPIINL